MDSCPACGGTNGHTHTMTESHIMNGAWGCEGEAGDSGINVRRSLVACVDCDTKFSFASLRDKGYFDGAMKKAG